MKLIGNLYNKIISIENLQLADAIAQKGKRTKKEVVKHNENAEQNIIDLHRSLVDKTFRTSRYSVFKIYEPKEREIFKLPYYPDRILHHAIINVLRPVFISTFTADTYSCIPGRGIHLCLRKLKKALLNKSETTYCLKLDIKKFYPNIDHTVLKELLRRKFKDTDLLCLLDEIIDSAEGLPIGNLLSQYFANFFLTGFDHCLKEVKKVSNYFRYLDDVVILSANKVALHELLSAIKEYLTVHLKLTVKSNHQIFPVAARGIDFLGYVSFHTHTRLRKRIKKSLIRTLSSNASIGSIASLTGWAMHCDSKNLLRKYSVAV
jgi:retron-type reverse transcriptase